MKKAVSPTRSGNWFYKKAKSLTDLPVDITSISPVFSQALFIFRIFRIFYNFPYISDSADLYPANRQRLEGLSKLKHRVHRLADRLDEIQAVEHCHVLQ